MTIALTPAFILAAIALICGILLLIPGGRWGRVPLAAIALICLAVNQLGIIK